MTLASIHLGPIQFDQPVWLALGAVCWVLAVWIGRQTLSGMGTTARRVALVIRLIVIALLVGAVARPSWRREGKNVNVAVILDKSESVPKELQTKAEEWLDGARKKPGKLGDTLSTLTAASSAYVQSLPGAPDEKPETNFVGATDGTNLAEGARLAMAVMPSEMANRMTIISDGNENRGDLASVADAARAQGIPIDVLLMPYKYENEVMVDRLVAPSTARMGQNINLRVLITARKATTGRLSITVNDEAVDLDAASPEMGVVVDLEEGMNALTVPMSLPTAGPQMFGAVFEPTVPGSDNIVENNRSLAVTFVQSEGRVLIMTQDPAEAAPVVKALQEAKIAAEVKAPGSFTSLVELGAYDAVVMMNTPAQLFSEQQQEELKSYVHDLGGGLLMTGGPESFGAGGWLGSPLADALPIKLDPPQKRQMPRGALAVVMHSCEMPQGNYWAKKTAEAAINNLSRLDMAGILEFSYGSGDYWVHPMAEVGNKASLMRAVNALTFGDMQTFDNMLTMALTGMKGVDAGMKHVIILSDGDPRLSNLGILGQYRAAKVTISTVMVYPHERSANGPSGQSMQNIATQTGGKFYPIVDQGQFATLPDIFIKEAQVVKRSLIWEGAAFQPTVVNALTETMRGVTSVPGIEGYVVAADRDGLSMVTLRGKENDPILAQWQFGLGKTVTFTSDAGVRWAKAWPSWGKYRAFWEQHIRWAMRPGGSADMRVMTEDLGDKTRVIVEALDTDGERLNFVRFNARVVGPDGTPQSLDLRQVGPGRYEGVFDSSQAGAYVTNLRYAAPAAKNDPAGTPREGNLQAAVTRPFADEYRTLQDNSALLRMVAERTGGRVLDGDPAKADLWSRAGLKMPVATRPIWLLVALLGVGLFLLDVGVRRVRIDIPAIMAWARRGMKAGQQKAGEQMGGLKEARARAQAGIEQRRVLSPEQKSALAQAAKAEKSMAAAKFEASADELAKGRKNVAIPTLEIIEKPRNGEAQAAQDAANKGEAGMSRLMKAKQRARDDLDDGRKG